MTETVSELLEQSTLSEFQPSDSTPEFDPPLVPLPLTKCGPKTDRASYQLASNLNYKLRDMGFDHVSFVDVGIDPPSGDEVPLLVVIPITDIERPKVQFSRKIHRQNERNAKMNIPPRMLRQGQHHVSLELDLDSYSNDNRLIFRAFPMSGLFGLAPVGYEDGMKYRHDPS